jgi:ribosomal protein S18 acetylase RimI-like enzyme
MMKHEDTTFVSLSASQVEPGSAMLALAFQRDPLMNFLYPNSARDPASSAPFCRATIRMGLLYGEVQASAALDSLAVWVSPGNTDFSFGQFYRSGFLTAVLLAGPRTMRRFLQMAIYVEKVNKSILARPHWHLMMVGVAPSQQGKGMGGRLLQPMLARADAEGMPCMLESGNERNLTLYQRAGFEVVAQDQIPNGGPQLWVMVREPGQTRSRTLTGSSN